MTENFRNNNILKSSSDRDNYGYSCCDVIFEDGPIW